jgi:hypothetical protein
VDYAKRQPGITCSHPSAWYCGMSKCQAILSLRGLWFLVDSSNQISTIPSTLEFLDNLLRQQIHTLPLSCIDWRKWPDIYCGMSNSCDCPSQPTPTLSNGNGSVLQQSIEYLSFGFWKIKVVSKNFAQLRIKF